MTVLRTVPEPTPKALRELVRLKHEGGDPARYGWGTRLRLRFGYFTPDEVYESTVARVVHDHSSWLDLGCGRNVFPNNPGLARELAARCGCLVGVDPDPTIEENPYVHRRARTTIDDFRSDQAFDVVTLRMVAEHIEHPVATLEALARLTKPGGIVVVYTVNRWSPVSVISRVVPFGLHHAIKYLFWRTEEKDTFPVAYRMNTRRQLLRLFEGNGFREIGFSYLDDCRTFSRSRLMHRLELAAWRGLRALGLRYPENCLLGIYEREAPAADAAGGR